MGSSACMRLRPQHQLGTAEIPAKLVGAPALPKTLCLLPMPRTTSGMFAFGAVAEGNMFDL